MLMRKKTSPVLTPHVQMQQISLLKHVPLL